jgi:hypothetical protein
VPNKPDAGFLRDPSGALVVSGLGTTAVVSSDLSLTSQTVLQNITGLGLTVGASPTEIWLVKYWLLVEAPNATMDINLGFTVPAGCTMKWGGMPGNTSNTPGFGSVAVATPPLALLTETQALQNGTPAAGVTGVGLVGMVFGGGTAGTVQIQYAQAVSNANPLKIDKGSVMEAIRVAS